MPWAANSLSSCSHFLAFPSYPLVPKQWSCLFLSRSFLYFSLAAFADAGTWLRMVGGYGSDGTLECEERTGAKTAEARGGGGGLLLFYFHHETRGGG